MRPADCLGDLRRVSLDELDWQLALVEDDAQRAPIDAFDGNEVDALVRVDFVNSDDVWMVEG